MTLREFLEAEAARATQERHARRWRAAIGALDGGSIALAVRLAPAGRRRATVEALAQVELEKRAAARRDRNMIRNPPAQG